MPAQLVTVEVAGLGPWHVRVFFFGEVFGQVLFLGDSFFEFCFRLGFCFFLGDGFRFGRLL